MVTVTLTWCEYVAAANVGLFRFAFGHGNHWNDANVRERVWPQQLIDHIEGAAGEMAWHKWRKRHWSHAVNTFHETPDAHGNVEVRTTWRANGRLIIRTNDAPDRWYVLLTGQAPTYTVRGWIRGHDALRDEWKDNPDGNRLSWWVPQDALTLEIPTEAKT